MSFGLQSAKKAAALQAAVVYFVNVRFAAVYMRIILFLRRYDGSSGSEMASCMLV